MVRVGIIEKCGAGVFLACALPWGCWQLFLPAERKRQCLQLFQSPADVKGKTAIRYVCCWVLLWLAFLKVNHGENCSQSCLEDTRGGTGGLVASSRGVGFTLLLTGPWVPTVMDELGLWVFPFLNWKSTKSWSSFPLSGEASATVFGVAL